MTCRHNKTLRGHGGPDINVDVRFPAMLFHPKRAFSGPALSTFRTRLFAQIPAQPADPSQAMPAQPVQSRFPSSRPQAAPPANDEFSATNTPVSRPTLNIIADGSLKAVLQELAQTWADSVASSPQVPITLTNAGTMRAKIESGGGVGPCDRRRRCRREGDDRSRTSAPGRWPAPAGAAIAWSCCWPLAAGEG